MLPVCSAGRSTQYLGQPGHRRTAGGQAAQWSSALRRDDWLPVRIYTAAAAAADLLACANTDIQRLRVGARGGERLSGT